MNNLNTVIEKDKKTIVREYNSLRSYRFYRSLMIPVSALVYILYIIFSESVKKEIIFLIFLVPMVIDFSIGAALTSKKLDLIFQILTIDNKDRD